MPWWRKSAGGNVKGPHACRCVLTMGNQLLDDQHRKSNPGYSLIGGLKGLAEIRGVELAMRQQLN